MNFQQMCDQLKSGEVLEISKDLDKHVRVVLQQTKEDVFAMQLFNPYDWKKFKKMEDKGPVRLFDELRLQMIKTLEEKEKGETDV